MFRTITAFPIVFIVVALASAQAPQNAQTKAKAQPVKSQVEAPKAPVAPAEAPPPPIGPIPFAPFGQNPAEQPPNHNQPRPQSPQVQPGISIFVEKDTTRFLVFDDKGWLPDVKRVSVILSVDAPGMLEVLMYPGAYAPSNPKAEMAPLHKIEIITAEEFQTKLDEASGGQPQSLAKK